MVAKLGSTLAALAVILACGVTRAQHKEGAADKTAAAAAIAVTTHKMMSPAEITWSDGPPSLPRGAQMAVLYGDPGKSGPFIMRLKFPADYRIPAHWHPTDENVTVISGSFMMGMANKLEPAKAKSFPVGSFITMPAKTNHFAMTNSDAVVQVSAMGPFEITYLNPSDDPRKRSTSR